MKKLKNLLKNHNIRIQQLLIALLFVLNLFIFLRPNLYLNQLSGKTSLLDFDSYRVQIESAKNGLNPYKSEGMITLGPPAVLIYFFPFSYLNLDLGRSVSTLFNIICGILLCFLLAKNYFRKNPIVWFLIFLGLLFSSFPVRFSIGMGQPDLLVSLLIGIIVIKGRKNLRGFSLAILSIVKSFFLFSFLAFLRKNGKIFRRAMLALAIIILLTFTFIKPEWYIYYFTHELPNTIFAQNPPIWPDYYNQSLRSTLFRLGLINSYQYLFVPLLALCGIAIFLTSGFELSIVSAILLSPISWQHYFVAFYPIFIMLFATSKKSLKTVFALFFPFLFWWIEFPWLHHAPMNLFNGILASHYFLSGLLLLILLLLRKR